MILNIIILLGTIILFYDLWRTYAYNKKSFIISNINRISTHINNRYIKDYKIVMSDIDNTKIRDLNSIELGLFINKIEHIIRRETKGIVDRIDTYKTQKGRHIIIYLHNSIKQKEAILILEYLNTDEQYKNIFIQKGYFTLFQVRRGKNNMSELERYTNNNGEMKK